MSIIDGLNEHYDEVKAERDRLKDLAIKTDEDLAREIAENSRLKADLDLIKRNMKKTWPECEIMDEVIRNRDLWKSRAEKLARALKECSKYDLVDGIAKAALD